MRPVPITPEDFHRYIAEFNSSDFEGFGQFYAPGIHFQGQGGEFHGRDAVLNFYRQVKSRVRQTLTLRSLVIGQHDIVADLETELHALEDWPDFPTGPLAKGETRRSESFVWYDHADGKFESIRSARYQSIPSDSGDDFDFKAESGKSMSAETFSNYIEAFNRGDAATYGNYYDDAVVLVIAGRTRLSGRQAIVRFYEDVTTTTHRIITLNRFVAAPDRLAVELESEFVALEDVPDFTAGALRKGGRIFLNTFVLYELRAGRFLRIRSAPFRKIIRP